MSSCRVIKDMRAYGNPWSPRLDRQANTGSHGSPQKRLVGVNNRGNQYQVRKPALQLMNFWSHMVERQRVKNLGTHSQRDLHTFVSLTSWSLTGFQQYFGEKSSHASSRGRRKGIILKYPRGLCFLQACPQEKLVSQSLTCWGIIFRAILTWEKENNPTPAGSRHCLPPKGKAKFCSTYSFLPQSHPLATTDLYTLSSISPFPESHVVGLIQYVAF